MAPTELTNEKQGPHLTTRVVAFLVIALTLFSYVIGLAVQTSFFTTQIIHRQIFVEAVGGGFLVAVIPLIWWMTRRFDSRRASGPLQLWAVLAGLFAAILAFGQYSESYLAAQSPSQRLILPMHDVGHGVSMPFPVPPTLQETASNPDSSFHGSLYVANDHANNIEFAAMIMHSRLNLDGGSDPYQLLMEYALEAAQLPNTKIIQARRTEIFGNPAYQLTSVDLSDDEPETMHLVAVWSNDRIHLWLLVESAPTPTDHGSRVFLANYKRIRADLDRETAGRIHSQFSDLTASLNPPKAEIERAFSEELFRVAELVNNEMVHVRQQFEKIGFALLLEPNRLAYDKPNGMISSFHTLDAAEALSDQQIAKARHLVAESRSRIEKMIRPLNERQSFLDTFDRSARDIEEFWALEREILINYRGLFEILEKQSGWAVLDGRIMFSEEVTMNQYNHRLLAIQQMTERQQEELRRAATSLDSLFGAAQIRLR